MTIGKKITAALEDFTERLESGEPIEATQVRRVDTPDGPMHERRRTTIQGTTKTTVINIRVTPKEKAVCEREAKAHGMTLAQWVRSRMIDDATQPPSPPPPVQEDQPPCERCVRIGAVGAARNINCPECGSH